MPIIEHGGASSFFVDGATYEVSASVKIEKGGLVRTPVVSSDGSVGYTTKYVEPSIEADFLDGPSMSIAALANISGSTLQVQMNNGKSYILVNATQIDKLSADVAEGKIPGVKFTGTLVKEVLVKS
jgi:hypothetical protein